MPTSRDNQVDRRRRRAVVGLVCVGALITTAGTTAFAQPRAATTKIAPTQATPATTLPTTAVPITTVPVTADAVAPAVTAPPVLVAPPLVDGSEPFVGGPGFATNNLPATNISIGGPRVDVGTEQSAAFAFNGLAGQFIAVRSNRDWALFDPVGREIASGPSTAIGLTDTGRYLIVAQPGLLPPASVQLISVDPSAIVITATPGKSVEFDLRQPRRQYARIALRGGQRYRMVVPDGQRGSACLYEADRGPDGQQFCLSSAPNSWRKFVLDHGATVYVEPQTQDPFNDNTPAVLRVVVEEMANDIFASPTPSPIIDQQPNPDQSVVVPFWGNPAERAVLSSPNSALVSPWGEPWIDREDGGTEGRLKVFAVPFTFNPGQVPFVKWTGSTPPNPPNRQRVGVYRGEDIAANVPTTGEAVTIRNVPWFAAVGSLSFEAGARYVVQVVGKNVRPLSLAVRDPSGKFTSSLSPWQWTEADGEQRAITTVSANRPGRWALELRLAGNTVRDLKVSALKVGSGGSYEGVVDVDDVLTVGDATDVQLGPNEFARLTVKVTSASPQIVQPDVLRYRNKTFQPTAVDMSLWDSRGRLVWSNNRNLEEEVLSGRLGKEPQLSERFATVASIEPYTLIIDPHTDLAGRFRVSIASTPVTSDVSLGGGTIPVNVGGTKTGVIEVRQPTRYRLTGADACLSSTSTSEWSNDATNNGQPLTPRCIRNGRSLTFPVGVHRLSFATPITGSASFVALPPGSPADPIETVTAQIDGPGVQLKRGTGEGLVQFNTSRPSLRLVAANTDGPISGRLVLPDGTIVQINGAFLATLAGAYSLYVPLSEKDPRSISLTSSISEVQTTTLSVGAKNRIFAMRWGQRLEATVVLATRTRLAIDAFADTGGSIGLALIADEKERRYISTDEPLPAGRYRFVFEGSGNVRIALKRRPLKG